MKIFKNRGLAFKITVLLAILFLIGMGSIALLSYNSASDAIENEVENQLLAVGNLKTQIINDYLNNLQEDLVMLADLPVTELSLPDFNEAFLEDGLGSQFYQSVDREFGGDLEMYASRFNLYDLFLMNTDGDVIYSVEEEADLGENLMEGQYRDSGLAEAFRGGREGLTVIDFSYYEVSQEQAAFMATPVEDDETGELLGVLAFQLPIDEINAIMQDRTGLGETGETYLVGSDFLMRSDSIFTDESDIMATEIRTSGVERALAGEEGIDLIEDYRGEMVFSSYNPLDVEGFDWVMLAEIDEAEAMGPVIALRNQVMIITLVVLIIAMIISRLFISRIIIKPVEMVQDILNKLSNKNLAVQSAYDSGDEIGSMSSDLNKTIADLDKAMQRIRNGSENVSGAAIEISDGNQDLSQRTEEQASSLEEFSATIEEIISSMESSAANAKEADSISEDTMKSVRAGEEVVGDMQDAMVEITESSQEIAEIIDQVNDIAFQTNLLALNAAVEAARAGDAGQGFAVVAAEVRNLAGKAAESANDVEKLINTSIEKIQNGNQLMTETEEVLQEIVKNTERTSDVVGEIAAALKEQNLAAGEIKNSIDELNQVTQQNAALVEEIASSSSNMSEEAENMAELVDEFDLRDENKVDKLDI